LVKSNTVQFLGSSFLEDLPRFVKVLSGDQIEKKIAVSAAGLWGEPDRLSQFLTTFLALSQGRVCVS
jgi:hypothetical protein